MKNEAGTLAQVPKITDWQQANKYLQNLRKTINNDVLPLLDTVGFAPFAINREVMSYIDHLGHLYSGKGQVGDRSKKYVKDIMSRIDSNYARRADEIYQMYRCGTVHEFEPKVLKNNKGYLLSWFCYKGERIENLNVDGKTINVVHLEPVSSNSKNGYWLPISTKCLIQDLKESINIFIKIGPEHERITSWNRAARELSEPVPFDFKL